MNIGLFNINEPTGNVVLKNDIDLIYYTSFMYK